MDQLLKSLVNIPNIDGDGDLGGSDISDDPDITRHVENVLEEAGMHGGIPESGGLQDTNNHTSSIETRVARCKEKQFELDSKFEKLQTRINALRSFHVGNHAAKQIQLGVLWCEKKRTKTYNNSNHESKENVGKTENKSETTNNSNLSSQEKVATKSKPRDGRSRDITGKLRDVTAEHADFTYGQLYHQMKHIQKFADADATESSSGGESADEHEKYPPGGTLYAPIKERAKYRWLRKRSEYAAQWGWIQSQISDLEFKIRQQTDMYKAYRKAKGAVNLEDPVSPSKRKVSAVYNNLNTSSDEESSFTCSRTRPVTRFKRRKLLDTYGLHHVNPKLSKPSTVSCSCLLPDEWCVLCFGRKTSRLQPHTHTQSRVECSALLDHSYHSVLSTQDDIPISTVLADAAHNKRWVGSSTSCSNIPIHLSKLIDINEKVPEPTDVVEPKRRKRREKRSKEERGKKRRLRLSSSGLQEFREIKDGKEISRIRDVSNLQDPGGRKKRRNSFDIDHVVIPYNISSTRVHKPKYKEILTPSWREVDVPYPWPPMGSAARAVKKPTAPPKPSSEDSDYEDISELAISLLHAKAEEEERIRWATPLGRVHGGQRTRANRMRRLDSCITEASSEANTPDPLSPGFIAGVEDFMVQTRPCSPQDEGTGTPMLSSPAHSSHTGDNIDAPGSSSNLEAQTPNNQLDNDVIAGALRGIRRRTSSQTYRGNRNRNLSEASQGSSRCTSPGPLLSLASPSPLLPSGQSDNLQFGEGSSQINCGISPGQLNITGGLPGPGPPLQPVLQVVKFNKRQFPLSDEEFRLLEEEDGRMRPPPLPRSRVAATATIPFVSAIAATPTTSSTFGAITAPISAPSLAAQSPANSNNLASSSSSAVSNSQPYGLSASSSSSAASNSQHYGLSASSSTFAAIISQPSSVTASCSEPSSRTTSRSSSVCEDTEEPDTDPDWEGDTDTDEQE